MVRMERGDGFIRKGENKELSFVPSCGRDKKYLGVQGCPFTGFDFFNIHTGSTAAQKESSVSGEGAKIFCAFSCPFAKNKPVWSKKTSWGYIKFFTYSKFYTREFS